MYYNTYHDNLPEGQACQETVAKDANRPVKELKIGI